MKNITDYIINERGPAPIFPTGHEDPCCIMIQNILNELMAHSNVKYNINNDQFEGADKDVWNSAGQFLYDYVNTLSQNDIKKIVDYFGWKKWVSDINDISPMDISQCISLALNKIQ